MKQKNSNLWIEVFGWYGTVATLAAYALNSFNVLSSQHPAYQILNVTGAFGLVVVSFYHKNSQPAVLNAIWMIIGLASLLKVLF